MEKKYRLILNGKALYNSKRAPKEITSNYRYTEENPYISNGASRETKPGVEYTGFRADVAEFNDKYMCDKAYDGKWGHNKMGLGIDEVVAATINFARKNYSDYFPDEPFPSDVKLVGNSIKSKKMPEYIAKFLEKGIRLLLRNDGQGFLNEYYAYIDKICNYRIPLAQIASKGKVKKSLKDYVADCKTLTKAGTPKARQAWMELALKENLDVKMGETLYYINTGTSKSHADIKTVTAYYGEGEDIFGERKNMTTCMEKEYKAWKKSNSENKLSMKDYVAKNHPDIKCETKVLMNCHLLSREIIESEHDVFCKEGEEYNVPKYVDMFNKRITPLLVCFQPSIRKRILVDSIENKPYFTKEECELCSGYPNEAKDQDTYEALMTMEDKEIAFWKKHPEWKIPFLEECGMDWDKIVKDYDERKAEEDRLEIGKVREAFSEALIRLTPTEISEFVEESELPKSMKNLVVIDATNGNLVAKEHPEYVIGTMYDIIEARNNLAFMVDEE